MMIIASSVSMIAAASSPLITPAGQYMTLFLIVATTSRPCRVHTWSDHTQHISTVFYIPGTSIAVDECMVRFLGRSLETTTIPSKPIPTGFKVWTVAQ
ncbi:Kinesin-like protein [Fusarium oxysporum f. sp. albedinis]|nr:Kinesin-like protein [Fusarium oxysporum f. sp. albedinis]